MIRAMIQIFNLRKGDVNAGCTIPLKGLKLGRHLLSVPTAMHILANITATRIQPWRKQNNCYEGRLRGRRNMIWKNCRNDRLTVSKMRAECCHWPGHARPCQRANRSSLATRKWETYRSVEPVPFQVPIQKQEFCSRIKCYWRPRNLFLHLARFFQLSR